MLPILTKVNCAVNSQKLLRDPSKLQQYIYCHPELFSKSSIIFKRAVWQPKPGLILKLFHPKLYIWFVHRKTISFAPESSYDLSYVIIVCGRRFPSGFTLGFVNYKKGCTRLAAASDKVYQLPAHGRWFSPGTPASSTTKTGRHDIAEILLKVALKNNQSINQSIKLSVCRQWFFFQNNFFLSKI